LYFIFPHRNLILDDSKSEEESVMSNEDMKPMFFQTQYMSPSLQSSSSLIDDNFESDTCEENDDLPPSRHKKRGIFPKSATSIMLGYFNI
jgi:hypothetical protein